MNDQHKIPPIVLVKDLSKIYSMSYGSVEALKNINLQVERGESLAIMGPSGSGKSTLMHLLGCLDRPTTGHYQLNRQDVSQLNDEELSSIRASQIGFVFQSYNLIPQLTVYENVEIPLLYQKNKRQDSHQSIMKAIEIVGLKKRINHLPSQLSGGEAQRVAIARALAINPLIIFADEPTGNLDSETGKTILDLFKELNRQGVTLIVVTHDESVGHSWQRLIRMRDGLIVNDTILNHF